jgi:hypothetical protein
MSTSTPICWRETLVQTPECPANRPKAILTRSPILGARGPRFVGWSMAPSRSRLRQADHFVGHVHGLVVADPTGRITPGHCFTPCHCSSILVKH